MRVQFIHVWMPSKTFLHQDIFLNSELFLPKGVLFVVSKYKQLVANRKRYNKIKTKYIV